MSLVITILLGIVREAVNNTILLKEYIEKAQALN